jgi:hypothetical protein
LSVVGPPITPPRGVERRFSVTPYRNPLKIPQTLANNWVMRTEQ